MRGVGSEELEWKRKGKKGLKVNLMSQNFDSNFTVVFPREIIMNQGKDIYIFSSYMVGFQVFRDLLLFLLFQVCFGAYGNNFFLLPLWRMWMLRTEKKVEGKYIFTKKIEKETKCFNAEKQCFKITLFWFEFHL